MRETMRLFAVVGLAWAVVGCGNVSEDTEVCPEVVTAARPPGGGACQNFGNPCQVPDGYVHCCNVPNGFCSGNEQCVDDPKDACDPQAGGTGCQGICQAP